MSDTHLLDGPPRRELRRDLRTPPWVHRPTTTGTNVTGLYNPDTKPVSDKDPHLSFLGKSLILLTEDPGSFTVVTQTGLSNNKRDLRTPGARPRPSGERKRGRVTIRYKGNSWVRVCQVVKSRVSPVGRKTKKGVPLVEPSPCSCV